MLSEATAVRRRFYLHLVDATDGKTPETGEAAGQPEISKNGAAFASTSARLTAIGDGSYYVELTTGEIDTLGKVIVRFKSAETCEFQEIANVVAYDPYAATNLGLTALPTANPGANTGLPTVDANNRLAGIQGEKNTLDALNDIAAGTAMALVNDALSAAALKADAVTKIAGGVLVEPATDKIDGSAITDLRLARLDATVSSRAAPGAAMALVADALTAAALAADAVEEIAGAILVAPAEDKIDGSAITEARLAKLAVSGTLAHSDAADTYKATVSALALEATAQAIGAYVDDLESRLTAERAGYLDELNIGAETLAHTGNAASFMADVAALALEATLTAIKGDGWTDETLVALKAALDACAVPGDAMALTTGERSAVADAVADEEFMSAGITDDTLRAALKAAWAQGAGKWTLVDTTLTLYAPNGTTVVRQFTIDSAEAPTERIPV